MWTNHPSLARSKFLQAFADLEWAEDGAASNIPKAPIFSLWNSCGFSSIQLEPRIRIRSAKALKKTGPKRMHQGPIYICARVNHSIVRLTRAEADWAVKTICQFPTRSSWEAGSQVNMCFRQSCLVSTVDRQMVKGRRHNSVIWQRLGGSTSFR